MCSGWCNNWVTRQHARCNNENTDKVIGHKSRSTVSAFAGPVWGSMALSYVTLAITVRNRLARTIYRTWQHGIRSTSVRPVNSVIEYLCRFLPACNTLLANEEAKEILYYHIWTPCQLTSISILTLSLSSPDHSKPSSEIIGAYCERSRKYVNCVGRMQSS